ncbi:hypothetical protein HC823_01825 [Candidatus Gracilibacteria bacterium]|nr:hypothetical protein [Candidatus Gracilibacteria bacterium]
MITVSKLGALMCFSLMGLLSVPVLAEDMPSCHQMKEMNTGAEKIAAQTNDCSACTISQHVWSNPLVHVASNFYTKLFTVKSHECPFKTDDEPKCKFKKSLVATNDPPDKSDCPCRQLKEKNSVQLRL